jgi:hypothetical protein
MFKETIQIKVSVKSNDSMIGNTTLNGNLNLQLIKKFFDRINKERKENG